MSDSRFNWNGDGVVFDEEEPVEKHYLYMHDQETHAGHGTRSVANESKYIKRATKVLVALKKAGGLKVAKKIFSGEFVSGEDNYGDAIKVSKAAAKKLAGLIDFMPYINEYTDKISDKFVSPDGNSKKNSSIASVVELMGGFFEGYEDAKEGGELHDRIKRWTNGKVDHGLDLMWAATQLAIKGDSVFLHRGMEVSGDTLQRIAHGDIQLADVDTIGHWSEDIGVSDEFSEGGILFVVKVPKKDILYTHRIYNFNYDHEQEVVPLFTARPKVKNFHVNFDEMSGDLGYPQHKKKGHKKAPGEHPLDAKLIIDLEFASK